MRGGSEYPPINESLVPCQPPMLSDVGVLAPQQLAHMSACMHTAAAGGGQPGHMDAEAHELRARLLLLDSRASFVAVCGGFIRAWLDSLPAGLS